jgi:DNA-binding CsgD family transcriptional regulator
MDSTQLARDVEALGRLGLSPREFVQRATTLIARRVEFDAYTFLALDPGSLLPAWAVRRCRLPSQLMPRLVEIEVAELSAAAANRLAEKTFLLSAQTEGTLERSLFYRELLRPQELEHRLRIVLHAQGMTWGSLGLARNTGKPDFDPDEVALLERVAVPFAQCLRRMQLQSMNEDAVLDDSPAVIVLSADLRLVSCTAAAEGLLAELGDPVVQDPEWLPLSVRAVALRASGPAGSQGPAMTRVRSGGGQWLTIRAAPLDAGRRVAVVIERTPRSDVVSLVLAAHGLTARESEIAMHVLHGLSTQDVSEVLGISAYTVQDHMKSIFDKTGVSSRKELAARLFAQYEAGTRIDAA